MKLRRKHERGLSLLELLIVVAVILIVAAMALPNIFNMIYNIRMRSAAQTVAGMMQTCRMQAVRDNTFYFVRTKLIGNATWVWVSNSATNSAPTVNEPQAILGANIVTSNSPPSFPTVSYIPIPLNQNKIPAFNARGLPCLSTGVQCKTQYNGGLQGQLSSAFQLYLTGNRPFGGNTWAAVMVSPAGRVQTFIYDGNNWGQ